MLNVIEFYVKDENASKIIPVDKILQIEIVDVTAEPDSEKEYRVDILLTDGNVESIYFNEDEYTTFRQTVLKSCIKCYCMDFTCFTLKSRD